MWVLLITGRPRSRAVFCPVKAARHGNDRMVRQAMVDPRRFGGHCLFPGGR